MPDISQDWHTMTLVLSPAGFEKPRIREGSFYTQTRFTPELLRTTTDAENLTRRIGVKLAVALGKGEPLELLKGLVVPSVEQCDRWDGFQTSELRELEMSLFSNRVSGIIAPKPLELELKTVLAERRG